MTTSLDLFNFIRDAMRYRILRQRQPGGIPKVGVPYVAGWHVDDDEKFNGEVFYAYEGELDHDVDEVLYGGDGDDPVGDAVDALIHSIVSSPPSGSVPTGEAVIEFNQWVGGTERLSLWIPCEIEVMMVSFTTGKCRIRGSFSKSVGPYVEGERFGNMDTFLTDEILRVIKRSLMDPI